MKYIKLFEDYNSFDLSENEIKQILDKNNIIYSDIKILGEGANGIAIDLSGDKVLKITIDKSEYYFAKKLLDIESKNLVKIFKVWKEEYFYCIVEEKLITKLNTYIHSFIYYMEMRNPISPRIETVSDEEVYEYFSGKIRALSKDEIITIFNKYKEVYYECMKYNIPISDFSERNVGIRKTNLNSLVYFDISDPYNSYSDKN